MIRFEGDPMSHVAQGGDDTFPPLSNGRMRQTDDYERGEPQRDVGFHRHRMALDSGNRGGTDLGQHGLLPYGAHVPVGARRPYADRPGRASPCRDGTQRQASAEQRRPPRVEVRRVLPGLRHPQRFRVGPKLTDEDRAHGRPVVVEPARQDYGWVPGQVGHQ